MVRADLSCVVCTNGEVVFSRRDDTNEILVECRECRECRECLTGYCEPTNIEDGPRVRMESTDWPMSEPSTAEIRAAGLGDLIAD